MGTTTLRDWGRSLLRSPVLPFAALSILLLWAHEPWRDEAEVWLIARDSPSLGAFFQAMRYEGTPALWHLMLMPLAKLGLPFLAARILHVLLATAGVALVWLRAPFGKLEKWLFAFGYYTAYEYNAIARSYALFALLLFAVATLHATRRERPIRYAVALSLLAQSTLHGLIVAGIVAGAHGLEVLRDRAWTRRVTAGAVLVTGSFLLAMLQMRPPPDLAPWLSEWQFAHPWVYNSFRSVLEAFIPIPSTHVTFWNTSIFDGLVGSGKMLLSGVVLLGACWTLRAERWALGIFLAGTVALEALFVLKYYGGAHHAGLVFLLFVFCLWLARSQAPAGAPQRRGLAWAAAWFLPAILVLQVAAAGVAIGRDATGPFSAAGELADYLEDEHLLEDGTFVAVYHSHSGMPVLAQMDDPHARFFLPELGRNGTFPPWSAQWQAGTHWTLDQVLAAMDAAHPHGRRLLIEDAPAPEASAPAAARLTLLRSFGTGVVGSLEEHFDLYEVRPAA